MKIDDGVASHDKNQPFGLQTFDNVTIWAFQQFFRRHLCKNLRCCTPELAEGLVVDSMDGMVQLFFWAKLVNITPISLGRIS